MKVSALINEDTNKWDHDLVMALFDPDDALRIFRTALPPRGVEDRLIWHGSRDGNYSVRAGYTLAASLCRDVSIEEPGAWNLLWKLRLPPRVKDFLWRACRNVLPTRVNLFSKRVGNSKVYVLCGEYDETIWHLLMDCSYAKDCWTWAGCWAELDTLAYKVDGFGELIFHALNMQPVNVNTIAMVSSQVWKEHNAKLWNGSCMSPSRCVFSSAVMLREWEEARWPILAEGGNALAAIGTRENCRSWHAPISGVVKINVDAAFFEDSNQTAVGMIIRDESGLFILAKVITIPGCVGVDEGEAMGFLEALSWVKNLNLEKVVIEGDSKIVVDALNSYVVTNSVFVDYIQACKLVLRHNLLYTISFAGREANILAHKFARMSREFGTSRCWLDPPAFVDGLCDHICHCNNMI